MTSKRVGIVIYDKVEVLDFCGPFEVFSLVRLNEERRQQEPSPFEVLLVAEKSGPVVASGGMKVLPDCTFEECPRLDILCVPGGQGTRREVSNAAMLDWLRSRAGEVELLTSVCTGAMLLGGAGLLDGRKATTHWASLEWMRSALPHVEVKSDLHVVEDGDLVTSAGISAGIDMALKVVSRCCGEVVGRATAKRMEYPYPEDNRRRVAI